VSTNRLVLRMVTLMGLVLSVMILTLATLTFVQAEGSAASITIVKEADQMVVRGSSANFTIDVTNTGDVTLTNVTVSDAEAPNCDRTFAELLTGEHPSYGCAVAGVTDDFVNTATVTGTTPEGGEVTHSDTAFVDVIDPGIRIAKTPDMQTVVRGSSASFNIDVSNSGDVTLTNVTVSDAEAPSCDRTFAELPAGEYRSYSCAVAGVTDGFVNRATATGTTPVGGEVTHSDTASVDVINPGIQIAKTPDLQTVVRGSSASFDIDVSNTGDVALTNVTVSDAEAPNCDRTFAELLAGEHRRYSCEVANVADGFINSATATGTAPVGGEVTDADAAKVRLDTTQPCPADMIAYWKLDEVSGYRDFYYGREGECAGSCPAAAAGHYNDVNGAQAFDGNATGIDVPAVPGDDSFNWGVHDSFSIEFWLHTDSASTCSGNQVVVGRDDSSTDLHWWTGCWDGGQAAFYLADTSGNLVGVIGTETDLTDGSWHHVVAVRDADANEIHIYVDGFGENSTAATYTHGFDSPTAALNIGWLNLVHGFHFNGIIDEVALYDRALDVDEVRKHYNEGLAGRWYCEPGTYPPIIVSTPVTEATVGRPYIYDVEAAGNPAPTYTLVISPTGMTIDTVTGLVSWMPTVAQEGSHAVNVEASNSEGTDAQDFVIVVSEGTICPADMVAYWRLDETSGITYDDFYDGHDGTCGGQCPTPATGYVNGGQEFNGSNTEINVPVDEAFDWGPTDSFSIEFWMQTDSASTCAGNEVIVGRDDSSTQLHWWTGCWDGGQPAFYLVDVSGTTAWVTGTTDLADGSWHHVVAVRDANANEIRIYVDGFEENSTIATYAYGFGSATAALNIGWIDLAHGFYFNGIVDEVAVYNKALSEDEIERHYNHGEPGPGYCINPDIAVEKTANPEVIHVWDNMVTYNYTVTNPGDAPLLGVMLTDDKCSPVTFVGGDNDDDELDPGESWVFRCLTDLGQDTINTATVTGTHRAPDGTVVHTDMLFVDVISPTIVIEKVADSTTVDAGDIVTYTYTVTNTGDDPLSDLSVSDDKCGSTNFVGGDENSNYAFDPDEIWTYFCSMELSATTTNIGTATGTDSAGYPVIATDTATVEVKGTAYIYLPMVLRNY
jgi:uncharacterized repeat protein (TIGR01451 family)